MSLTFSDVLKKKMAGDKSSYEIENLCRLEGDGVTYIEFRCLHTNRTMACISLKRSAKRVEKRLEVDFPSSGGKA
jgi:hypothetical protein